MLHTCAIATLVMFVPSASAQTIEPMKDIKFCAGRLVTLMFVSDNTEYLHTPSAGYLIYQRCRSDDRSLES